MTLLTAQCSVDKELLEADVTPIVKSRLLHEVAGALSERVDCIKCEHSPRETTYRLKLHVFSEAELTAYTSSIIHECAIYSPSYQS